MVTCKLYGRFGNQLFQIATTIALALRNNTEYHIPPKTINTGIWPTYFKFSTKSFRIQSEYKEPSHTYSPIPYIPQMCIDGFFQSEKYFSDFRKEIMDAILFPALHINHGCVSVHVRRGDYLKYQDKHPVVGKEYITQSIDYFKDKGYKKFLFFSDDIKWCEKNFPGNLYSQDTDENKDIVNMAHCEHNIIANSSFSWWGAWLNRNPDKIIIAPKIWFGHGNAHLKTKDLLPQGWIAL